MVINVNGTRLWFSTWFKTLKFQSSIFFLIHLRAYLDLGMLPNMNRSFKIVTLSWNHAKLNLGFNAKDMSLSYWCSSLCSNLCLSFYPRPVLAFGYCRCMRLSVCPSVCVCGNHLPVRAITHHLFKLGSPNLDHRCKRPWLRSLLFWGVIDLDLQGQI